MKPLPTAPASAHKLHRPQAFCMKDRPNDNYLEVTFFGEATGPDKMIVAAHYFGFCETPSVLRHLDQWIRRRLRSLVWKQWQRGRRRYAALVARGVGRDLAAQTAGSAHGPWRVAVSPALHLALPTTLEYFTR